MVNNDNTTRTQTDILRHEKARDFIQEWKRKEARAWAILIEFWKWSEPCLIHWKLKDPHRIKTIERIIYIINRKKARFLRFVEMKKTRPDLAVRNARQAIAWFMWLWYGISEGHWQFGTDPTAQALREGHKEKRSQYVQKSLPLGKN